MADAIAAAAVCSECGETLGAKGACLACLLRAGLDEADGAPPNPAADFGDFEIERREDGSLCELGRGAMGITYRALDKVLHRSVALKVIEPAANGNSGQAVRERFLREARAAAALRHPNVAAVFQFGLLPEVNRCYCAMELVEGETLEARIRRDGPLHTDVALEIAIQITRALVAAGERGLVHRDLKPGNIMLAQTEDPTRVDVKVIDFGLAKAATAAGEMELTHGGFVGTPAFASPEQFAGDAVDARSDIYALGVTLWFALTGRLPSAGTTLEEIRQRQVCHQLPLDQLQSRGVPERGIELLRSCLAVDPAERPASARELMRALEDWRDALAGSRTRRKIALAAAGAAIFALAAAAFLLSRPKTVPAAAPVTASRTIENGIAVLPFENLSAEKDDAFFAEGIQDDVLTSVGKIQNLKVISRASVEEYRDGVRAGEIRHIGETLGVSHVLTGSVRRVADRVALNVALIDTRDERQVWAERYERSLPDTLSLQGELAIEIARALQTSLSPAEKTIAAAKPTENPDAYLLYLRGRELELGFDATEADSQKATEFYEGAIKLDPTFALARARLSILLSHNWQAADHARKARALAEAEEAMRLQPMLGEGRLAMAYYRLWGERDYDRALAELSRAAVMLPNSADVPRTAAYIYKWQNRFRDRIAALQRAETLAPRDPQILGVLAMTLRWVRDWPEAIRTRDRLSAIQPNDRMLQFRSLRANDEFRLTGNLEVLKRANAADAEAADLPRDRLSAWLFETAMFERDYAAAERLLMQVPAPFYTASGPHSKSFHHALLTVAREAGAAEAQKYLESAREETDRLLAALGETSGARAFDLRADLAILDALLGRKDAAIRTAQRAVELERGAIENNTAAATLALVYARCGEPEKAVTLIEHLLTVPAVLQRDGVYNITLTDLKWRWVWDPLRSHPRFQKLLAGPEPKTVY
jgi:serine/threonine protein kinase